MKRVAFLPAIGLLLIVLSATSFAQILPPDFYAEAEYDCGEITVGEVGNVEIIVENNGDEVLNVTAMNVSGANADEFTVTEGGVPFSINGGETHKIVVAFAPKADGARAATWEFVSNSPYSPNNINLKGTAIAPQIPLKPAGFEPDNDPVPFGEVLIGEQAEMSLIITNPGELDLVINNASIAGDAAGDYTIVEGGAPFTITPGMTHEVKFTFKPTAKGERKAQVAFEQENNTSPFFVELSGICVFAPAAIELDTMSVDFGTIKIGQVSERTITIGNTGDDDLNITEINITGINAADFAVKTGITAFTVKKGETYQVTFTFTPSNEGDVEAQVSLVYDSATEPYVVNLYGAGEAEADTTTPGPQTQTLETEPKPWDEEYRRNLLSGPLSFCHLNGLWALSGYGSMEWTSTTPVGHFYTTLSLKTATFTEYNDQEDFDGSLTFMELMGRYGIIENLEAGLKLRFGGWTGTILVPGLPADSEGSFSLGDMFLSMKYKAIQKDTFPMPYEMSALLSIKLPFGSQDDALGTGGLDISLNLLNTMYFSNDMLALHLMLGFTYALDGDKIETDSMLWGFMMNWGLGVNYIVMESRDMNIAVIWQLEFYDPNLDTTIGGRADMMLGGMHWTPELGLTLGLHKLAADMEIYFSIGLLF